jgi:beta-glucanase (GH16 family)
MSPIRTAALLAASVLMTSLLMADPAVSAPSVRTAAAEAAPADLCGPPVPKPDGGEWVCVGGDDFSGTELDRSLWTPLTSKGRGTTVACNADSPRTVAVREGTLRLTVRRGEGSLRCPPSGLGTRATYVTGSVSTMGRFSQQYGRFEARIKAQATTEPGLQEAFWLWPAPGQDGLLWPAAGEIDVSETYSQHHYLSVPFLHYGAFDNGGPRPGLNTAWDCQAQRGVFHTYTLEWDADRLAIFVDGRPCLVNTDGAASFRKRFFVNLTQLIGRGGNAHDGRAPLPATMQVDYVRVWR